MDVLRLLYFAVQSRNVCAVVMLRFRFAMLASDCWSQDTFQVSNRAQVYFTVLRERKLTVFEWVCMRTHLACWVMAKKSDFRVGRMALVA
jgi:hypothetical protein